MRIQTLVATWTVGFLSSCGCGAPPPNPDAIPDGKGRVSGQLTVFQGASALAVPSRPTLAGFVRAHAAPAERTLREGWGRAPEAARAALQRALREAWLRAHPRVLDTPRLWGVRVPPRLVDGDVIVRCEDRLGAPAALELARVDGLVATHLGFASEWLHLLHYTRADGKPLGEGETRELAARLGRRPGVRFAEVNGVRQPLAVPNDNLYPAQWHYPAINLPAAWDVTQGSAGVVVAVIDTGITNHPDLNAKVLPGIDLISDATRAGDGDGVDDDPTDMGGDGPNGDSSWHGTHVAGTVGAATDNGTGVAGVAWNARLLPVRVLGRGGGTDFDIAAGITWAAGNAVPGVRANPTPAQVINLSLGGAGGPLQSYQDAFDAAFARGVLVAVAAGNDDVPAEGFTPCNQTGVLCIGATRFNGSRTSYSNYGSRVDLMAPGGEPSEDANGDGYRDGVLSTFQDPSGPVYLFDCGTSMATPHVAGVLALMKARSAQLTQAQAAQILESTANPASKCSEGCGAGLLDAHAAVLAVTGQAPAGPAKLVASATELFLTPQASQQAFSVTNSGGSPLSVDLAAGGAEAARLAVGPTHLDLAAGKSASVSVGADFSGLAAGTWTATLQLASNGGSHTVNVKLKVQAAGSAQDAVLAFAYQDSSGTWQAAGGGLVKAADDYRYQFDVSPGPYWVAAAIDSNGNGAFFENGEPGGFWPNEDSPQQVVVENGRLTGSIDFVLSPSQHVSDGDASVIGGPCTDNAACGTNGACVTAWEGGYCTRVCGTEACPLGARCVDVGAQQPVCLGACDGPGAGQSTCRTGYVCYDDGTGGGVCLPRCTQDADCGTTCDTATGYCRG